MQKTAALVNNVTLKHHYVLVQKIEPPFVSNKPPPLFVPRSPHPFHGSD
jgi:hypothetical protein